MKSAKCMLNEHSGYEQELLEEQGLEVINQCDPDVYGSAMLQYILPERKVREECKKMTLEINTKEVFGLWIRLHFSVVGERQYQRQVMRGMQD